ncbi:MAG: helix-turn-helix domain-containing protein [Sphingobacterium sp.]
MDKIFVKNMVCNRCIMVVQDELEKLGLAVEQVTLGEVHFNQEIAAQDKERIHDQLYPLGFEIIDDKKSRTIEKIKNLIIEQVHHQEDERRSNLSDYLSDKLNQDYSHISNLFSEIEGTTIEKYYIAQKIEKVKELLVYDELSLSEIASRLNYSSVSYLSNQFKKVTGLSPSHFKKVGEEKRKPLDEVK